MSSYPDAFRLNCVGKISCNNNHDICQDDKNINKKLEKRSLEQPKLSHQTTHCLPYKAPREVIQDNSVDFKFSNTNTWSNTRGYGNIVIGTSDLQNNIHGRVHPWNRINPLSSPYQTPVVVKNAWAKK